MTQIHVAQNTSEDNFAWIENLAIEELNMEETGIVHFNEHLDTNLILEESSVQFMEKIKSRFEFFSHKFNQYRSGNSNLINQSSIRLFKISNTVNDFMLFRNSLKLIVARKNQGIIYIGFSSQNLQTQNKQFSPHPQNHEIIAHIGPFNSISWRYQTELVDIDSLVKHYLSEFIKQSAR
jgi:hypothetical protein